MKFYERILRELKAEKHTLQTVYGHAFSFRDNAIFEESRDLIIRKTTYAECETEIKRISNAILSDKPEGGVVALVMGNSPLWVECFWAILRAGFSALLLSEKLDAQTLAECLTQAGCKYALGYAPDGFRGMSAEELKTARAETDADLCSVWGDEIILATSGTTGKPKLAAFDGSAVCAQILNSGYVLSRCRDISRFWHGEMRQLAFLPFSHVFGLSACFLWFTIFGRTFVFLNDMRPETILRACRLHSVTHIFGVPLLWDSIAQGVRAKAEERGEAQKLDKAVALITKISRVSPAVGRACSALLLREARGATLGASVRFCISGGGCLKAGTIELIRALGYRLENGYGMTEIGIACVSLKDRFDGRASVGSPFPSLEFTLGDGGRLSVRGASVNTAFYSDGRRVLRDPSEWFDTGDCFQLDDKGEWSIVGRIDDLVNGSNGERVSPDAVEALLRLPADACAFGDGGVLKLVVSAPGEYAYSPEAFRAFADSVDAAVSGLPAHMRPQSLKYTFSPLPKTHIGKVNRRALKAACGAGSVKFVSPDSSEPFEAPNALAGEMAGLFAKACGFAGKVGHDSNFFTAMGGDSLSYMNLIAEIESKWRVSVPREGIPTLDTPRKAAERVLSLINEKAGTGADNA